MRAIQDYRGVAIRLTDERLTHLRDTHPEVEANEDCIDTTLAAPQSVVQSAWDEHTLLYYRAFEVTGLGEKLMCVLVVVGTDSPFVLTAYFTDRVKKGVLVWPSE